MLVTELKNMFVYVGAGSGEQFKKSGLMDTPEYKNKVIFIEDDKTIYTHGKPFGVTADTFTETLQRVVDLEDFVGTPAQGSPEDADFKDSTGLFNAIDTLKKDLETELNEKVDEILGDSEKLQDTLNSISEIDEWILAHNEEFEALSKLSKETDEKIEAAVAAEQLRAETRENGLEARVKNLEEIEIWEEYDMNIVSADTPEQINEIPNTEEVTVVLSDDNMEYFTNPINSTKTFQNLL